MKYYVTYEVTPHPDGIEDDQIPEGHGAADHLVVHSILGTPGEKGSSLSVMPLSINGASGGRLASEQLFVIWALWAHSLMSELPPGGRRDLCEGVHLAVSSAVLGGLASAPKIEEET